jgi:hypothetical protein
MAGGAAGPFGGVQNCQGTTLAVGASCQVTYTFAPTAPGPLSATTGGSITGQPFAFTMYGNGNGTLFTFGAFSGPIVNRSQVQPGSMLPVMFTFDNTDGSPLSASDATALATACRAQVVFTGAPGESSCATYDPVAAVFQANLKTARSLGAGSYDVTANLLSADGTAVLAHGTVTIRIK